MAVAVKTEADPFARALRNMDQLRQFTGPPQVFWHTFLENLVALAEARVGVLMVRQPENGSAAWKKIDLSPAGATGNGAQAFGQQLDSVANACAEHQEAMLLLNGSPRTGYGDFAIAVRLEPESPGEEWVAAFYLPDIPAQQAASALRKLRLVAHTPDDYHLRRSAAQSQVAVSHFSSVLDLMALLNAEKRFLAVAMTLCNEIASRHRCDRVSLGWLKGEYIRLQAISHTEKFEKKMEAVRAIEQTMEEALDQDEVITWPAAEGATVVTRDHGAFSEAQKVKHLCSIPLRLGGDPVAVLLCERNSEPFSDQEVRLLGLFCEMAVRRLSELKHTDRWVGARAATASREGLAKVLGVEHTWAKVITVAVAVTLGVLFFGGMTYRVEAPFILRTDDIGILSAPFNGYIDEVPVEIGDPVKANDVLLQLDKRDLLLEEAGAVADLDRYRREAEKSRATNALAEMRIALAQAEQSRVHLDLGRYRLGQSSLRAPFEGVVIEGDLKKKIASPVKQGDLLFKIARTDKMYVECEVKENDIHEIRGDATGEIAFASQPRLKFPMHVERIQPVAEVKEQKNVFIVRCFFDHGLEKWWRPGMSGVAKLNVGRRTFFWIISHRTVDFLRMYFWL